MATRMQQRRGTSSQWSNTNPILASGEIGFETNTGKFKMGDGSSTWLQLSYFTDSSDFDTTAIEGQISTAVSNAVDSILDGAPAALDTLKELATAIDNNASFASTIVQSLSEKTSLSTVQTLISSEANRANAYVLDHNQTTTNVHGITDTSALATKSYADNAASDAASSAVSTHNLDETNVHGIADTSALATKSYADNAVSEHQSDTTSVHGIADTSKLVTTDGTQTLTNKTITSPSGLVKADVGLGNVDNTSDANKPVSTAAQSALDLKANLESPTFTGTVTLPTGTVTSGMIADGTIVNADINASAAIDWTKLAVSSTVSATELGYVDGVTSSIQTQLDAKLASASAASTYAPIASPTFTGTVSGVTKSMVGLGNVDNTSDANKPVSTATQTALDAKLSLAGGTMTGALTLSGAPTADSHAATKAYVDGVTSNINFHQPVRVATTGNITLSGTQTIDGVALSVGDRVLVKDQSNQKNNGIYEVKNNGWTRTADADNTPTGELAGGDFCLVLEGTVNSGYGYVCSNTSAITIGTTDITYAAFNAAKAVSAGTGLTETTPGTLAADSTVVQFRVSGVSDTEIGYLDGVTSAIQTQLDAKAPTANPTFTGTVTVAASGVAFTDGTQTKEGVPSRTTIIQKSAAYTLSALTERDSMIEVSHTGGTAVDITIPANSSVAYPVGTSIDVLRTNTGGVRIVGASGVTVNATPGAYLRAQWSAATLFKRATDSWVLIGDLATA